MFRRPTAAETEEDLLKQQQEFFKSLKKEPPTDPPKLPEKFVVKPVSIVGDVVERTGRELPLKETPEKEITGFPGVFRVDVDENLSNNGKKKRSLFAQKFEEKCKVNEVGEPKMEVELSIEPAFCDAHDENIKRLKSMTQEEIIEEKKLLESTLSPEMLSFLKERGAKKINSSAAEKGMDSSKTTDEEKKLDVAKIEENVRKTIDKEWMELDQIEPDKLQWIGDIPDSSSLEPGEAYSARFDFTGNLLPFQAAIDVRTSLHHHGDEPERPGYTIQELYQLSRSTVLQQRILSLTTLANIIRKTKMGYYDSCFDGFLLKKLVESDFFFLLRFAVDDRSATAAAVHCLHELFVCRSDEICLDRLQNVPGEGKEPFLFVPMEKDKDTDEAELKDHQIIALDLVRGVLRTDLLVRLSYILNNFELDPITISKIFEIVTRVCRHSPEACEKVFGTSSLMQNVFDNLTSSSPNHECVKLLRVIASSQSLAQVIVSKLNFDLILRIIETDEPRYKLKLECLALWKTLLNHGFLLDQFQSFTPCLTRLLMFYVAKVDIEHGRFDFELFSGIVSILNTVQNLKHFVDKTYETALQTCAEKWLTQLSSRDESNFSVSKAVGSVLYFFVLKYKYQGVQKTDLDFLKKLSPILGSFLSSKCFILVCEALAKFSHIAHCDTVDRDPENLPSLCSVYRNGADYLQIVHDESPMPLVQSLLEFVLAMSSISRDFDNFPFLISQNFEKCSKKILSSSESPSWFSRYEIGILISLLKIKMKCKNSRCLDFGFALIPHLRTDDERILSVFDCLSELESFSAVSGIYKTYVKREFKETPFHFGENFTRHWVYETIATAPRETLMCLSNILEQFPSLISQVPISLRFSHLCLAFLNDENYFNPEIRANLEKCLLEVFLKIDELDLDSVSISGKTFYELYRDLVGEYASSSYGDVLFAKVVTLPLAQKFDISYRKLMWSEFMHALRVINLPKDVVNFVSLDEFTTPVETDESLLVLYLNAVSKDVLTETRNGFIYNVALENVRKFLNVNEKDENLGKFLRKRINEIKNESLKNRLLS